MEDITSVLLRRLQGRVGTIAYQLTQFNFSQSAPPNAWHPPLNAFLCDGQIRICVELAGVEKSTLDIRVEPRRLRIRGHRQVPEPCGTELQARQILAMEIDYGPFDRVVELPVDVEPAQVMLEQRNGLLWIQLPLRSHG